MEGLASRIRELQAKADEQQRPVNNAEVESLAKLMRHSRAMQARAYDQLGADKAQP